MNMYVKETDQGLELTRRPNWFYDDGRQVEDSVLMEEKIFPVKKERPEVDYRVKAVKENPKEEWEKREDGYHVTYSVTDLDHAEVVANAKEDAHRRLDEERDRQFDEGFSFDFSGTQDNVQIRPQDKTNLLGLRLEAMERLSTGDSHTFNFRAQSNTTRQVSPNTMVSLTSQALDAIESIYEATWARKDLVDGEVVKFSEGQQEIVVTLDAIEAI